MVYPFLGFNFLRWNGVLIDIDRGDSGLDT